jgi:hypothetical protein
MLVHLNGAIQCFWNPAQAAEKGSSAKPKDLFFARLAWEIFLNGLRSGFLSNLVVDTKTFSLEGRQRVC